MGHCPEWYSHLKAAKYLGVAPWDLLEQPVHWREWAIQAERAEQESQKQIEEAQKRRARTPKG